VPATVYEDLTDSGTHQIVVRVRSCTRSKVKNRACELNVEDTNGTRFQFVVWEKSEHGREYDWQAGHWYELSGVTANVWPNGKILHGSSNLRIKHLSSEQSSREATILYITDSHLGKRTHTYGGETWSVAPERGFQTAMASAVEQQVDGVVHGGDLFHNPGGGICEEDIETCRRELVKLAKSGIPFYFIYGNHERDAGRRVMEEFVDHGLAIHLGPRYELINDAVAIYGIDYRTQWRDTVVDLEPASEGLVTMLCIHQSVGDFSPVSDPDCELRKIRDASDVPLDLIIAGHAHTRSTTQVGDVYALSGGATTRVGSDRDALQPSAELLTVYDGEIKVTRQKLDTTSEAS